MKSYTDIEQSKNLAEILPLESADCFWDYDGLQKFHRISWFEEDYNKESQLRLDENNVCAWSLAALLDVLPDEVVDNHYLTLDKEGKEYCCCYEDCNGNSFKHCFSDNPIDACVEMIIKLHELKML